MIYNRLINQDEVTIISFNFNSLNRFRTPQVCKLVYFGEQKIMLQILIKIFLNLNIWPTAVLEFETNKNAQNSSGQSFYHTFLLFICSHEQVGECVCLGIGMIRPN